MKSTIVFSSPQDGKTCFLANFIDTEELNTPKLVIKPNSCLVEALKNVDTTNVFFASDLATALNIASSFNGKFIVIADNVSVTVRNHETLDIIKGLQLKYGDFTMKYVITVPYTDETASVLYDRLLFTLGVEIVVKFKRESDYMTTSINNYYTDVPVGSFNLKDLAEKYYKSDIKKVK